MHTPISCECDDEQGCELHFWYDSWTNIAHKSAVKDPRIFCNSMMRSMLGFQRRLAQKGSRYKSSFALGEKAGFVKPDGPVCLIILDGVGLGDMEVSILN